MYFGLQSIQNCSQQCVTILSLYITFILYSATMRSCDLLFVELCRLCEDWWATEGGGGGGEIILGLNCC